MSKFKTTILVDVAGVLAVLPKGSAVTNVSMTDDRRGISVFWEHDDFKTLYVFPVDCPDPRHPPVKPVTAIPLPAQLTVSGQDLNGLSRAAAKTAEAARLKTKPRNS